MPLLYARFPSLAVLLLTSVFLQCQELPPEATGLVYLSADRNDVARQISTGCAFRYAILNTYGLIDDAGQREAIRAGFALWQTINPNVGFLDLPDRAEVRVQFVDPAVVQSEPFVVSEGLVRGTAMVGGRLRQDAGGTVTILLSNTFKWDKARLTKAIAYHAGLFLGMTTSADSRSVMSPVFTGGSTAPTKTDSATIRNLSRSPCKDLSGVMFLPCSLKVSKLITKTIKFDKQGTVVIQATGSIRTGNFVGYSTPDGLDKGLFNFPIDDYNIVKAFNHASLLYKLNNEANWHLCGSKCTLSTNGNQYVDFSFEVNDNDQGNNTGAYDVVIDYQK